MSGSGGSGGEGEGYIPSWDRNAARFVDYERGVGFLKDGTKAEEHGVFAAWLAQGLAGKAWEWGEGLDRTEPTKPRGLE